MKIARRTEPRGEWRAQRKDAPYGRGHRRASIGRVGSGAGGDGDGGSGDGGGGGGSGGGAGRGGEYAGDAEEFVHVDAAVGVAVDVGEQAGHRLRVERAPEELFEAARELGLVDVAGAVGVELAEEGAGAGEGIVVVAGFCDDWEVVRWE